MNLGRFPRRHYSAGPTPIQRLDRLSAVLGGPTVYMKRDDLLGPAGGGNKTRKLEFLMADALALGADTVITCGAIQSNHCRLTLAAANLEGLGCHLVLHEPVPGTYDKNAGGNNFLYHLLGVEEIRLMGEGDAMERMEALADELRAKGQKPYIIPMGGSNAIGSLGYAACVLEMLQQLFEMDVRLDAIVTTSGSTGTHAGLLTAVRGLSANIPVVGISVITEKEFMRKSAYDLTLSLSEKLGLPQPPSYEDVIIYDDYIGGGYSLPTPEMVEAVRLVAKTESILLDPVYTGKTMAGMIDLIRKGRWGKDDNVLFLHTGGSAALPVYQPFFQEG